MTDNDKITLTGIPLELFMRAITVSLETMKIVRGRRGWGFEGKSVTPLGLIFG